MATVRKVIDTLGKIEELCEKINRKELLTDLEQIRIKLLLEDYAQFLMDLEVVNKDSND